MLIFTARTLILILSAVIPASAQSAPYTPVAGSSERKAIMESLRGPIERDLKQRVVFKVTHLKVQGAWAFIQGMPEQPGGKAIDYRGTEYEEAINAEAFDDGFSALLQRRGGKWKVRIYIIGATDVPYEGWDKEYGAPSEIFHMKL
jgi:hypothetical protein